jgi:hypothetical protein
MKRFITVFTTTAALGFLITAHGQNLLTNGSFDVGFGFASFGAGSTNLPGWTITGNRSLYWVTPQPAPPAPPLGTNYVDLNGAGGSITLAQSFPTTPGRLYEVSFVVGLYNVTNGGFPYSLSAAVLASNGVTLASVIAPAPNVRGWANSTRLQFIATTHASTVQFTDTSGTVNYDLALDDVSAAPVAQTNIFAEYTAFDANAETATGVLNGVSFVLQATRAVSRPGTGDNGGVVGAITNNTSVLFNNTAVFAPALDSGDELILGAASDYRITFTQPVSNVTLHLYQLQANRLSFTTNGAPASFSLLSSDGDFIVSPGNTALQGSPGGGDDASGSLFFPGTFTELSWISVFGTDTTSSTVEDGIRLQLSVTSETRPRLSIIRNPEVAPSVRLFWRTNFTGYVLEASPDVPATNWARVTNDLSIIQEHFTATVSASEAVRFFRLRKD